MTVYHVVVERAEKGWPAPHALEDDRAHTQGKTLEITRNIREVADLLHGQNAPRPERRSG